MEEEYFERMNIPGRIVHVAYCFVIGSYKHHINVIFFQKGS